MSGAKIQPVFKWLTSDANTAMVGPVEWNFEKFLINSKGQLVKRFKSGVTPLNTELTSAVESLLK